MELNELIRKHKNERKQYKVYRKQLPAGEESDESDDALEVQPSTQKRPSLGNVTLSSNESGVAITTLDNNNVSPRRRKSDNDVAALPAGGGLRARDDQAQSTDKRNVIETGPPNTGKS
ncbi:PREDICTED: uncharacterized protein LOC106809191 [Priapulus caudatus]|uniref:Uncharacterized protein LOC106809191 n=1 Tax=Priapulus caudatus TaxID=37621 RepID=A0ABM1E651_PRICU|nr:PREDICTED: uncharacterized protein LOC106809191 [Priapulus caudatus]